MKHTASRFIAILLLVIPGLSATWGFLKMKNSTFDYFSQFGDESIISPSFDWLQFLFGFVLFAIGVGFIGGWIFFRDKKRNYLQPRFQKNNND
ncbi:DUF2627 domain-containing protein [Longirhabdus pacifica]|uniref:DUF2627 domain-containing protein n=1 Tax=Longirhabdus pacifica TaxID=2305227 RepID=UPI001008A34E|nr:DUF2627 domain-containing protein [Longirhabdus pacifica]